ncbi:prophage P1 protein 4 [Lactiplantibacillus plantarum]|nr:prophage P1 protein 4 [Lactiplantibacillus plantarum]
MHQDISRYELIEDIISDLTVFVKSDAILYLLKDSYSEAEYDRMLKGIKDDLVTRFKQGKE